MFRSVVVSHDGSRCVETTVQWLEPLLGKTHAKVELYGRRDAECASELNSPAHLEELAAELRSAGADVQVLGAEEDLFKATQRKLVVVHDPSLALRLLRETTASVFFTPEGVSPHVPARILVPLDGSEFAAEILPLLVPFARAFTSQVELLRVAPKERVAGQGSLMVGTRKVATRTSLLASLESARTLLAEQGVDAVTRAGEPGAVHERILQAAATDQADLIAVSTHGHGRVARWLFGSCAETLISSGATPLLVRNTRTD